eukprot:1158458-Pelagomonas_calceolata.AAC.9
MASHACAMRKQYLFADAGVALNQEHLQLQISAGQRNTGLRAQSPGTAAAGSNTQRHSQLTTASGQEAQQVLRSLPGHEYGCP